MNNPITQVREVLAVSPPRRKVFTTVSNKKKKYAAHFSKVFAALDETNYDFEIYSSLTDHGDFD